MNAEQLKSKYAYFQMVHGATLNVIKAFPDDKLDWHPAEGSRSAREIVEHIYAAALVHAKAVQTGTLSEADYAAGPKAPAEGGTEALAAWADETFKAMHAEALKATDGQLAGVVKAFYGEFTGAQMLDFNYDELWHHRGQLTVYLRLLGVTPPFVYDYYDTGEPAPSDAGK